MRLLRSGSRIGLGRVKESATGEGVSEIQAQAALPQVAACLAAIGTRDRCRSPHGATYASLVNYEYYLICVSICA